MARDTSARRSAPLPQLACPGVSQRRRATPTVMTMLDLGPERPGPPSDTRQLGEFGRASDPIRVSGKVFWIAVAMIAVLIAVYAVAR